ncbi:MAG: PaaI family thioesterase, partial [Bacteriovoracaceae bacterium]
MSVHDEWLKKLAVWKEDLKKKTGKDFLFPPPSNETLQVEYTEIIPGKKMAAKFPYQKRFSNPVGLYQGGFLSAAIDEVLGPLSYITAGVPCMTLSLNVTFLKAFPESLGHVLIEGFVLQYKYRFIFVLGYF